MKRSTVSLTSINPPPIGRAPRQVSGGQCFNGLEINADSTLVLDGDELMMRGADLKIRVSLERALESPASPQHGDNTEPAPARRLSDVLYNFRKFSRAR